MLPSVQPEHEEGHEPLSQNPASTIVIPPYATQKPAKPASEQATTIIIPPSYNTTNNEGKYSSPVPGNPVINKKASNKPANQPKHQRRIPARNEYFAELQESNIRCCFCISFPNSIYLMCIYGMVGGLITIAFNSNEVLPAIFGGIIILVNVIAFWSTMFKRIGIRFLQLWYFITIIFYVLGVFVYGVSTAVLILIPVLLLLYFIYILQVFCNLIKRVNDRA